MLKKILFCIAISLYLLDISKAFDFSQATKEEKQIFTFGVTTCKDVQEIDYPTIFVPGIGASWYSQEGYNETKVKRWIPDPISHAYDTLFYTFKQNGYRIADVFYKNEFKVDIQGNPKQSLYLFGYDWKKDNKVTATILTQLVGKILQKYEQENGCSIGKVNVIAHSMGGLVSITIMIAESDPKEKDLMVRLVMNLVN